MKPAGASASTFFVFAQRELLGKEAGWKSVLYLPFLMGLGIGIGINNAKAVLESIWGAIRQKPSVFVRTPKYGVTGMSRHKARAASVFTLKKLIMPTIEIAFGLSTGKKAGGHDDDAHMALATGDAVPQPRTSLFRSAASWDLFDREVDILQLN